MRGFAIENLGLKALSLLLALLVWLAIAGETASEIGLRVPLELQNMPPDLELSGDAVDAVEVRLRASAPVVYGLQPGDVAAQIDLGGSGEGERIVHLSPESIRVPFGVRVVKITPASLTLSFEQTLQKSVRVAPRLLGQPAENFEVVEWSADPATITIAGPRSRVRNLASASTEPLRLDGAKETVSERVVVGLEDPQVRVVGSPEVRATARIREIQETRRFEALAIEARSGAASFRPASVSVRVKGPSRLVRRMSAGDLRAFVDVGAAAGSARRAVSVEIAPGYSGVTFEEVTPAEVALVPPRKKGKE